MLVRQSSRRNGLAVPHETTGEPTDGCQTTCLLLAARAVVQRWWLKWYGELSGGTSQPPEPDRWVFLYHTHTLSLPLSFFSTFE